MASRPNILWVQTDEQRPDSLACYGSTWARTPPTDRLAAAGTVFRNCVCQSPVCVPSRISLLACEYPQECHTLMNDVHYADARRMRDLSEDQVRQVWRDYMGLCAYVDHELGRLLDALDAAGLRENTIVVFSADHGQGLGEWGATET